MDVSLCVEYSRDLSLPGCFVLDTSKENTRPHCRVVRFKLDSGSAYIGVRSDRGLNLVTFNNASVSEKITGKVQVPKTNLKTAESA
jgi:hypothetical protein